MTNRGLIFSALLAVHGFALAQESSGGPFDAKLPPLEHAQHVLAAKVVRLGIDTLTYQRVSAPAVKAAEVKSELLAISSATAADEEWDETDYHYLSCSITSYTAGVSEIQWVDDEGGQKRIFVHDDLSYLGFSFGARIDGNEYGYCVINFGGYEGTQLSDFSPDVQLFANQAKGLPHGSFVAVPAATKKLLPLTDAEVELIDVILAYYQVNRERLKIAQEEAEARAIIEAKEKRIRDLTPKTIEIRFWPVASQRYPTAK